jgi:hypothetical protein
MRNLLKNKGGFVFLLIVIPILIIVASIVGFIFLKQFVTGISGLFNNFRFWIFAGLIVAIILEVKGKVVSSIILALLGVVKSIFRV